MPKIMEAMVPIPERSESVHLQFEQEIVVIKSVASGSQLREDARWKSDVNPVYAVVSS